MPSAVDNKMQTVLPQTPVIACYNRNHDNTKIKCKITENSLLKLMERKA